jgi:hypothetical protein
LKAAQDCHNRRGIDIGITLELESPMRRLAAAPVLLSSGLLPSALAVLLLLGGSGGLSPAQAQQQPPAGPAMTPDEIAGCLCQKEVLDQQQSNVDVQGGLLQERQQELANLDAEIKRQATSLSSNDTVGQKLLQDLIAQQIALRNLIQLQIRPAYNQLLNQLRTTIETYNAQCTQRPRYVIDLEKAQQNLQCPKP